MRLRPSTTLAQIYSRRHSLQIHFRHIDDWGLAAVVVERMVGNRRCWRKAIRAHDGKDPTRIGPRSDRDQVGEAAGKIHRA